MTKIICGDANQKGNIQITYKGGCRQEVDIKDAYRCVGCGGWFHLDCILKHFELEKDHDVARNTLVKLKEKLSQINEGSVIADFVALLDIIDNGLKPTRPLKK